MNSLKRLVVATTLAMVSSGSALAASPEPIFGDALGPVDFPQTSDGRLVLPVDTHAHTVFSDGFVWPTLRANEALREKLAAFTISEHVEGQPHAEDIPNPDRNRSHQIASEYAGDKVHVILGAEITRRNPPGHLNAIFLEDVNPISAVLSPVMGPGGSAMSESEQHAELKEALKIARSQGAFIIWNHPADGPSGIDEIDGKFVLNKINEELLSEGLVDGIEVANGEANIFLERALQVALDYDLTMIGASDTHGNAGESHPYFAHIKQPAIPHRVVTLVLSKQNDLPSIKQAMLEKATVALFQQQLIGRPKEVKAVVRGAISIGHREFVPVMAIVGDPSIKVRIENASSIAFTFRETGGKRISNFADTFTVPAKDGVDLIIRGYSDPADFEGLQLEVVNSYVGAEKHFEFRLSAGTSN